MILFNNKLEMFNTIIIIIIIVFLLTCLITNYFKSIENFETKSKYGIVACPPQFTKVGNTDNIYYNEGNIGIGTSSPSGLLHIAKTEIDNSIQDQLILECHNNLGDKGNAILFKNRWNTGQYFDMARIKAISRPNGGALIFETNGSGDTTTVEAMRIDEFGNTILAGNLSVNGLTNGMKIGQSWSVSVGGGVDGWLFQPNVHNRIFVKIKFHFYNEYYSMIGQNTPASGPVDLTWENDKAISGMYLPYPYTNQGPSQGPKFWFMRMSKLPSYLMRIIVVYYDSTRGNYEDLLYA